MRKEDIWLFRMVHYQNLPHILEHGLYCSRSPHADKNYVNIGSGEVIGRRDTIVVKCHPDFVVNDYVPFYFGVRTPMLFKILTGNGVLKQPQEDIVYLCCRFAELTESNLEWCFTDGNAATRITEFFTGMEDYAFLDWKSIDANEWSDNNSDGDHDRMRKKHAEFLVKGHVPVEFIRRIVVHTERRRCLVQDWVDGKALDIIIDVDKSKFYFA
jgi:hypothetical protein